MNKLTVDEVTMYFLYGSPYKPKDLNDDSLIRPKVDTSRIIGIDTQEYMTTGPGRFANPTFFEIVERFFYPHLGSTSALLDEGSYKKIDLINMIDPNHNWGLNIYQTNYDDGKDDYVERAYIWNSTSFMISNDAVFHVDADGTRWIENFAVVPRILAAAPENFDFETKDNAGKFANYFLQPAIDPSNIGRKVILDFDNSNVQSQRFTEKDYIIAYDNATHPNPANLLQLTTAFAPFVQDLWDSGVTNTVDEEGRVILYGTDFHDKIDAFSRLDILGALDPLKKYYESSEKGVSIISGKGNDDLIGGVGKDRIDGGDGNDKINGAARDDKLFGRQGTDIIIGGDGDDYIDGGDDDDTLEGGAGLDVLLGGEGNDILAGGEDADDLQGAGGFDIYSFVSNDFAYGGSDTVSDSDAQGVITVNGLQLTGGVETEENSGIYISRDGAYTYQWNGGILNINNTINVANFRNFDLGIFLERAKEREEATRPITAAYADAQNLESPLVLDLNGNGVKTVGRDIGAYFDFNGSGKRVLTGWVASSDGLLVYDRNHNKIIDNGKELFGNNGEMPSANGFAALALLDSDRDGVISSNDAEWSELQVWRDSNSDGFTNIGELHSLADVGIKSLDLKYEEHNGKDDYGNSLLQFGSYQTINGENRDVTDVWFAVDTATVIYSSPPLLTVDVAMLPYVFGMGNSGDLRHAVREDGNEALQDAIMAFAGEKNNRQRSELLDDILLIWGKATNVTDGSRGPWFDAKKLKVLETFTGSEYYQWKSANPVDPGGIAQDPLNIAYSKLHNYYYSVISAQTFLNDYYDKIVYSRDPASNGLMVDLLPAARALKVEMVSNPDNGLLIADFVRTLKDAPPVSTLDFSQFQAFFSDQSQSVQRVIATALNGFVITDDHDMMYGTSSDDVISGLGGDDMLFGGDGDDIIEGGAGDDRIEAVLGADTIFFSRGDGMDIIFCADYDSSTIGYNNNDTLKFLDGISPNDVTLTPRKIKFGAPNDLIITINGTSDGIVLENWLRSKHRIDRIDFADGTVWDIQEILERIEKLDPFLGTPDNDSLNGDSGANIFNGLAGDDQIDGGQGADTYLFGLGDGKDRISEFGYASGEIDTIRFGAGINPDDIIVSRNGNDIVFSIKGTSDSVTVASWMSGDYYRIERIEFTGGAAWDQATLKAKVDALPFIGTSGNDSLNGDSGANVFNGLAGDDRIDGGQGADTYLFGLGDGKDRISEFGYASGEIDTIRFGAGINADDIVVSRNSSDIVFSIKGTSDSVTVANWMSGDYYRIEQVEFANGSSWDKSTLITKVAALPYMGTDGDDSLSGDDGANIFVGGKGNDTLEGSGGSETYLFNLGDGKDIIDRKSVV